MARGHSIVSAGVDMQESPGHRAPTSGRAEVDVDQGAAPLRLDTLNQRFHGELRL